MLTGYIFTTIFFVSLVATISFEIFDSISFDKIHQYFDSITKRLKRRKKTTLSL